jgi:predicted AlkP superfamily pyrophosphatase or phosphodiesterase
MMSLLVRALKTLVLGVAVLPPMMVSMPSPVYADDDVKSVLLLSVDGLHAVDLEICIAKGICPNLAMLADRGLTYTNASTTKPSDSFPGLLAQITGGT